MTRSLWLDTTQGTARRQPPLPTAADVVVLGAGIAGLTTAYLLARTGRSVLVLEAHEIGGGVSGHTTAKLTAQHELIYHRIGDAAARYGGSQLAALEWVFATAADNGIDCDLERTDSHVHTTDPAQLPELRAEVAAAVAAGLPAEYVDTIDPPLGAVGAVRFRGQAQFHPRKWLLGLAQLTEADGGQIIEGVRATGLREGDPSIVRTTAGSVRAKDVVVATHYPIFDRGLFFARLEPTRDLVVAGPASREVTGTYLDARTHHSVRAVPTPDGRQVVVGGEHYRVGDHVDVNARFAKLAAWAREHVGLTEVRYRWSAHDMSTVDSVPYVGRYHPRASHLWVATGFGQWGMTGGTAAGMLLRDLVAGEDNEYADLYDPNRFSVRAAAGMVTANATVAKFLAGDHVRALAKPGLANLRPGEARVTSTVAAYRDESGALHAVRAHCTHLGCLVAFNNAERTWDCPCHGSRFDVDGQVIQGPAVHPLRRVNGKEER
ncbi:FAD-dependent oxidoreductase [Actinophytocola algeriensis]|uniref:Glycine/D-amino acid oxidase-like deaminating enzyme/nitrite reductase/ring-hydroxylating ferredoxin subunit n=1 Tax=Actinophytocola algeriensis TaxID=1768010 RepID=A0A7W7VGW8_9PSEU|nr:FAD-dependent oxidoreductase [Actinophytocola algeriensis]MBB4909796.1 glycine/D-amino acid oxidase-like deaminating enzyme/nitrite reductase/ring-hydroxylating ferredoxin subunit [Actinophytocola algeriensis]MBE1475786.1 glycine/D-amino acid oxidase-like deaminating enzyme/nitrite reductase/ring-hydroxylating ferredoxin subunit [Actinophytocola algeriensis]